MSRTPHELYVLVDEHDNFANEVMIGPLRGANHYEELVEGEGIIKTLLKVVKSGASGSGIDRVFLTGVSPVVLSDMTSGYNVAKDITHLDEYHDLCGFAAEELADALAGVLAGRSLPDERAPEILDFIRRFCDGYRFGEEENPLLYNHLMDSEPALGRGYGDLLPRVRPDLRQYALLDHLLEFKTLGLKDVKLTGDALRAKTRAELRALPAVAAQLQDAEQQVATYRVELERREEATLKLRTHAVVGIGLERLVW